MSQQATRDAELELGLPGGGPIYDLVGIGFGPSNLALAIAIHEQNTRNRHRDSDRTPDQDKDKDQAPDAATAVFLERQPRFGWHRGMLIEDATMQVSFLKDLVTLRDPASDFSFLSYLHERERLIDFINHKNLFPLRVEFHDYLEWAAARVDDLVCYDHDVTEISPVMDLAGRVEAFDVVARHAGGVSSYRARNLVLATGLRAVLPPGVKAGERIWHNRDLLTNVARLKSTPGADPRRFVVVGAGQSAAEVTAHLHEQFPSAEVCAVFSRYGYSPADDSSFANRIFDPAAVDEFYDAPAEVKSMLMRYHGNTNYSVVDADLIDDLYRRVYREKVLGQSRLRLMNVSRLTDAVEGQDGGVRVTVEALASRERSVIEADVLVCATGYDPVDPFAVLGDVGRYCTRDADGRAVVERDYRLRTDDAVLPGIYVQGGTEHSHGISSSLLSNTAVRVGDILRSVAARRPALV